MAINTSKIRAGLNPLTYAHPSRNSSATLVMPPRGPRIDPHGHQRRDHGDITDPIQQKAPPDPQPPDEQPGDRRPDQAGAVHHRGIQRDRVCQVLPIGHHFDKKRLPPGDVQGVDCPLK